MPADTPRPESLAETTTPLPPVPHDKLNALWDQAVARYHREHERETDISQAFAKIRACRNPQEVTAVIDGTVDGFRGFRSEGQNVKSFFNGVAKILLSFSDATSDIVGSALPGGKFLVGAFTGLLKGVSALYDAMRDALYAIRDALERFKSHLRPSIPISPELSNILIRMLTITLELLTMLTKNSRIAAHGQRKWWRRILSALHIRVVDFTKVLVGDNTFRDKLQQLIRETNAEALQLAAETHAGVVEMRQQIFDLTKTEEWRQIRLWLDPADYENIYHNQLEHKHGSTCDWIFADKEYQVWKSRENGTYAIVGNTGTGKSVLCSNIAQRLQEEVSRSPNVAIAFFYFDAAKPTRLRTVFASLLIQLARRPGACQAFLQEQFHARESEHPTPRALSLMINEMMQRLGTVYLVLDALDQCRPEDPHDTAEQEKLINFIVSLNEHKLPSLRLLVSTRPDTQITAALDRLESKGRLLLQKHEGHFGDIDTFVSARLMKQPFSRWDRDQIARVRAAITDKTKSQGMFLWVQLQLRLLEKCAPKDVDAALASLPNTLEATYRGILERYHANIPPASAARAALILNLIAAAKRPLTVREAVGALAYNFDQATFTSDLVDFDRTTPEAFLSESLPMLIDVELYANADERSELAVAPSATATSLESARPQYRLGKEPTIHFFHFSVKEFLTSAALRQTPTHLRLYAVDPEIADMYAGTVSVASLAEESSPDFASYAKEHWSEHVAPGFADLMITLTSSHNPIPNSRREAAEFLQRALTLFLDRSVQYWVNAPYTPLHWAARYGLVEDTTRLLGHYPVDVLAKSERFHERYTPLTWTIVHGTHPVQLKTIDILLSQMGDVGQQTEYIKKSLLQLALDAPKPSLIVEHLVSRGAGVQIQDELGRTTLLYAVWRAEAWEMVEPVVKLLLMKGVDPNFFPDSPTY